MIKLPNMTNKLIEVLSIQSESYNQYRMFAYIVRQLKKIGCEYYTFNGCIYATKGKADSYPCIVSHIDTVHEIVEDLTVVNVKGNLTGFNSFTMEQSGIGGDDKVGIFIALQCLEKFDNIKAVFFRDEEVGCEGSYDPDIDFFKDCNFVLQCDRRGNTDFITNASGIELTGDDFKAELKGLLPLYGYKFSNGMMTDVMALKQSGIKCAMANISCGYYNPHCADEFVNIADVLNCLALVTEIIEELGDIKYICKYKAKKNKWNLDIDYSQKWGNNNTLDFWLDEDKKKGKAYCECCNENEVTEFVAEFNIEMCNKCIKEYVRPYHQF